ncbi:acyl-CoA thioesterase [Planctomycetia bacterium]|jgi:acyl-CoA thioester hydrolase|nr:acyl-CoA thioesterase [Planctomycetia bacterium]
MSDAHEIAIRVRYQETDGQRRVHHANFITYFEIGRTEMLRSQGLTYREFETAGLFLVVADISCRYVAAAEYDDLLLLRTRVEKVGAAHVCHAYELHRGSMLIATGTSTVVCVDREGRVRRLPAWMPERR